MADTLPTVKISDGHGGFVIINESDFDPKQHKKLTDKEEEKIAAKTEKDSKK